MQFSVFGEDKFKMGKKVDLSDFLHGMAVGARRAYQTISETAETTFSENGLKKRKYPVKKVPY